MTRMASPDGQAVVHGRHRPDLDGTHDRQGAHRARRAFRSPRLLSPTRRGEEHDDAERRGSVAAEEAGGEEGLLSPTTGAPQPGRVRRPHRDADGADRLRHGEALAHDDDATPMVTTAHRFMVAATTQTLPRPTEKNGSRRSTARTRQTERRAADGRAARRGRDRPGGASRGGGGARSVALRPYASPSRTMSVRARAGDAAVGRERLLSGRRRRAVSPTPAARAAGGRRRRRTGCSCRCSRTAAAASARG